MSKDSVQFIRPRHLPGLELVSVAYRARAFPVHMHAEYVVGVVTAGAEALETSGARHVVAAGDVLQLNPGQPHANRAVGDDVLRYRVFYLPPDAVRPWLDEDHLPVFDQPVVHRSRQADTLTACHAALSAKDSGALEQETALMGVVRAMSADKTSEPARARTAAFGRAIDRVRAFIDAHYCDDFGLSTLADVSGLSVYHLARSFKLGIGLSPLAYRNLRRVHEARRRLVAGDAIAAIACDLGFADQSHLTRQFQKVIGTSPAQYRA